MGQLFIHTSFHAIHAGPGMQAHDGQSPGANDVAYVLCYYNNETLLFRWLLPTTPVLGCHLSILF